MATIALNYYCDLNQAVKVQYIDGNVFSGDNAGNTISVFVMDGDQPATIGGSVSADVIRADGSTVAVSGALDGNRAYVILPQACYAVPGSISIVIKNTQNTTVTTIAALVGNVYRSSTDTVVDPGTIIPSISSLIASIDAAIGSIPADYSALLATIAADYSSSKTYPVGAYCWEAGVLKRCIVPITSAETYTAAHWTNAVIGDDLSALKSAINAQIVPATWAPGLTKKEHYKISDGLVESHNKYVRTTSLWNGYRNRIAILLNDTNYEYIITYYDAAGTVYLGHDTMASGLHYIPEIAAKFGISFRRVDQVNVSDSDVTAIASALSCYTPTDTTLTQQGMAADAKAVGASIDMTNTVDHLLNYAYKYGDKKTYDASPVSIEISRYGTKLIVDGNNGSSSANIRFKLNNGLASASSNAAVDSWADPVSGLKAGHKYKVSIKLISGNVTKEEGAMYPTANVYKAGYHASILQNTRRGENAIDFSGTFVAESGVSYHFAFVFQMKSSATNAIYQYIVEDITEKTDDLLDTIQVAEGSAWA